jgi:U3 small nucleolar RNA-associated protein 7
MPPSAVPPARPARPGAKKPAGGRGIGQRKVRARLQRAVAARESAHAASVGAAALLRTDRPGLLVAEGPLERTHRLRQPALRGAVDAASAARGAFCLELGGSGLGPYVAARYSRSGRGVLVAGRRGHVAVSTWRTATLHAELQLNETVRDAVFLHSDAYFAVAQKKYVHVYDASGTQLHVLRKHRHPGQLAYLPHHFLLASATCAIADEQRIAYTDTSTGALVADFCFGGRALNLGPATSLAVNLSSGVLNAAHSNGVVSLWSPTQPQPLARFFAHPGGARHVVASLDGRTLITAGADSTVRAWDARTFRAHAAWALPATPTALAVSQRGLVAAGFGATVHVWSGAEDGRGRRSGRAAAAADAGAGTGANGARPALRSPYMVQQYPGRPVAGLDFCPFEDVLAVCHAEGLASMIVPGAGEAVFDTHAPNPYETRKSRREAEVRGLLDKLRPETIALDVSNIGGVDPDPAARLSEMRARVEEAAARERSKTVGKRRAKGKGKISKQLARKQKNVVDARRVELLERREKERQEGRPREGTSGGDGSAGGDTAGEAVQPALRRFYSKRRDV